MRRIVIAVAAVVLVITMLAFARYETIAPCGMLRSEAKRHVLASMLKPDASTSGLEMIGLSLGVSMIDNVLEIYTAQFGPIDCINGLARLHASGGLPASLSMVLAERSESLTEPALPAASPPEWSFVTTTDPITDDVFARATIVANGSALWVYLADNRFHLAVRGNSSVSYDAKQIAIRIDETPAFNAPIFDTESGAAYVTLSPTQVDQLSKGMEALVRYDSVSGDELMRFPLKGAPEAIAQLGKPKPPPPRPNYERMSVDERLDIWKRQYRYTDDANTRSVWTNCGTINKLGKEPYSAGNKETLYRCMTEYMPLK